MSGRSFAFGARASGVVAHQERRVLRHVVDGLTAGGHYHLLDGLSGSPDIACYAHLSAGQWAGDWTLDAQHFVQVHEHVRFRVQTVSDLSGGDFTDVGNGEELFCRQTGDLNGSVMAGFHDVSRSGKTKIGYVQTGQDYFEWNGKVVMEHLPTFASHLGPGAVLFNVGDGQPVQIDNRFDRIGFVRIGQGTDQGVSPEQEAQPVHPNLHVPEQPGRTPLEAAIQEIALDAQRMGTNRTVGRDGK
jgi:hypothetical protein